jgi:UPF0755 protein
VAERPLAPVRRRSPSRGRIYLRRFVALAALLLFVAGVVGAVWWALPRVKEEAAPPPLPPPPPPAPFRVVFPEGFTRAQMVDRVAAVKRIAERKKKRRVALNAPAYRVATRSGVVPCFTPRVRKNLEGFLFPATYDFLRTTTSRKLVADQLVAFCRNWRKLDLRFARTRNLTPYDVLVIASMIERETQAPSERPLVAAVIYNRLKARMPLGIDATLRYGLKIPATQSIRQSQLASNSPYNTRRRPGLPPTPIGNPGLASLQAAARPAKVNYLFFARKPDRRHHFFTASEREFNLYLAAHGYGAH